MPCAHPVQFGGMCSVCLKDMTEYALPPSGTRMVSYTNRDTSRSSYVTNQSDVSRAQINMTHSNTSLTISQDEAMRVEEEAKRRLLNSKKLSLVVDLDQTIIHATVDPTVAEWQKDPDNPNYEAVKDVRAFQLVDEGPGARGCWYYIKLRPGLKEFLNNVSKLYELHIYTMGTRAYAQKIANLIDPDRRIFGDRILSRDESGSLVAKNLQRLFPVDTKMVVIIDDRGDVWKWNENLIKVTPYDFFVGIGDINSSFLPKKPKIKINIKAEAAATPDPNNDLAPDTSKAEPEPQQSGSSTDTDTLKSTEVPDTSADMSALEQLVSMGGGDNPEVLQAQANKQDQDLVAQLQDRPLLQKQKQLDAEDEAEAAKTKDGDGNPTMSDSEKPHHNLLHDDDTELQYLEQSLRAVHNEFFETYERQRADAQGGRLAELRGAQLSSKHKTASSDLDLVPDIKTIMPSIKARVLKDVVIVFSGVVPLGTEVQSSDIALWAKSFGARVQEEVSRRTTTHLIAARNRTAKVRQAVRRGRGKIKIVNTRWLMDSMSQWRRLDETPYLLKTDDGEAGKPLPGEESEILSESEEIESAVATDTDMTEDEGGESVMPGPRLTIMTDYATDNEEDLDKFMPEGTLDPKSPVGGGEMAWVQMDDEFDEWMAEDDDGDEADGVSVASDESEANSVRSKKAGEKRSHNQMTGSSDENSQGNRKKLAIAKSTNLSLSQVSDSGLPTPDITGGEEVEKQETDDGWDDFEDELEAEIRKAKEGTEDG